MKKKIPILGFYCSTVYLLFSLGSIVLGNETKHIKKPKSAYSYNSEKIARICKKFRQGFELSRSGNILKQLDLLRDKDPWVRARTYFNLLNNTNIAKICINPPFVRFDPWGKIEDIKKQVTTYRIKIKKNANKITSECYNLTDENIKEIRKTEQDDAKMLIYLIGLANSRLDAGDMRSIYLLKALLDYENIKVQAQALTWILLGTNTNLYPENGKGLVPGALDIKVIKDKKKEWLKWWEENNKNFKLKPKKIPR